MAGTAPGAAAGPFYRAVRAPVHGPNGDVATRVRFYRRNRYQSENTDINPPLVPVGPSVDDPLAAEAKIS